MKRTAGALAAVLLLAAGCGTSPPAVADPPAAAQAPRPVGVQDPAPPPAAEESGETCDPRRSLRPSATLDGPALARIRARGLLVAGVSQNAYQLGFRHPDTGELAGFEIDLVREIALDLLGSRDKVRFVAMGAADRVPSLTGGKVDLVARTMTMTCRDWRQVAFSTEYYGAAQRLLVPAGSGIDGMDDLAGKKVCAAAGSTSIRNLADYPGVIPVATTEVIDCLVLLQQHQIAAVSTSDVLLVGLAAQDPTTEVVGPPLKPQPYGVATAPAATDLVRFVNRVLERVRLDGTWRALHQRWLSGLGTTPAPPVARYRD
ncbi:glutamate ABC transporter substrate-binding protein [Phytohabitans houttuyneae]|uniref:glutamate ABC transporter substrate-binding protein n=1 Tax=Phytohabitans houttuyneae TaxID=1076126 RepID=UPI0015667A69|nr:glutamate ABC transporter substrate-binding protein [Phytohabitans houttuyneae]